MANYATLKAAIEAAIYENHNNEITGQDLQNTLIAMVNSLGLGYQFVDIATPTTNPGTPDQNVFYIAATPGTYSNFGSIVLAENEVAILAYNGTWTKKTTGAASVAGVFKLYERGQAEYTDNIVLSGAGGAGSIKLAVPLIAGIDMKISVTPSGGSSNARIYALNPDGTRGSALTSYQSINSGETYAFNVQPSTDIPGIEIYQSSVSTATSMAIAVALADNYLKKSIADSLYAEKSDTTITSNNWFDNSVFTEVGFVRPAGTESTSSSYRKSAMLPLTGAVVLRIYANTGAATVAPVVFYNSNGAYISGVDGQNGAKTYTVNVPSNAAFVKFSVLATALSSWTISIDFSMKAYVTQGLGRLPAVFIATNGNDANDGASSSTPVASFSKAKTLLQDGGTLFVLGGDYENPTFNIKDFPKVVGIGKVRFLYPLQKFTSATLVTGYTRVYSVSYTMANLLTHTYFLYQHDLPDAETEIIAEERHPLQKGASYRLPSTRIYQVGSIADIESTTEHPCWYYSNGTLYFSIASGSNLATNPVVIPSARVVEARDYKDVEISNIQFLYGRMELMKVSGVFNGVVSGMGNIGAGQIRCDYCKDLRFIACEAYGAHTSNGGDGINSHNTDTTISDRTCIELFDCWLHDNGDDGESCHENCLTIHHGGLVEYNGNGITPASGGSAICYDVVVRRNGSYPWVQDSAGYGFSSQGGVMQCNGCLAEHNTSGFVATSASVNYVAINCVALNNTQTSGYFGNIKQINCVALTT